MICEKPFFLVLSPDEGRGPGFFSWGVSAAQSATLRHATAPPPAPSSEQQVTGTTTTAATTTSTL